MDSTEDYQDQQTCQRCGACCATFRVSFYWTEATVRGLPELAVQQLNPWLACMAGTNSSQPRCNALAGQVGQSVQCTLYEQRPEPCRELRPGDEKCSRARARHGLPPLSPG
jgi:Fe-S-cluster containining protein